MVDPGVQIRNFFLAGRSLSTDLFRLPWSALPKWASKPCADINLFTEYGDPLILQGSESLCLRDIVNLSLTLSSTLFRKFPSLLIKELSPMSPRTGQLFK